MKVSIEVALELDLVEWLRDQALEDGISVRALIGRALADYRSAVLADDMAAAKEFCQ